MMNIPRSKSFVNASFARIKRYVPVDDEDLVDSQRRFSWDVVNRERSEGRRRTRLFLRRRINSQEPFCRYGHVVEETESHRVEWFGMMTRRTASTKLSADSEIDLLAKSLPNDGESIPDVPIYYSSTHLNDSSAGDSGGEGGVCVDVERHSCEERERCFQPAGSLNCDEIALA